MRLVALLGKLNLTLPLGEGFFLRFGFLIMAMRTADAEHEKF